MDDEVFRALADANRRTLLDRLFERDGQTLGELEAALPGMTRFGVMKHLSVLEASGLVTSRKVGRERHHYLNAVPIRRIHDRWLDRYRIRAADLLDELRIALEAPMTAQGADVAAPRPPVRVHDLHPQHAGPHLAGADGLDFTLRYYYSSTVDSDWAVGSPYEYRTRADPAIEGVILEADPPHRLALSFKRPVVRGRPRRRAVADLRGRGGRTRRLEADGDPRGLEGATRPARWRAAGR